LLGYLTKRGIETTSFVLCSSKRERNGRAVAFFSGMHRIVEKPSILIVSPVRNEGRHIARVVRGVAAQELVPTRWVVIDDGSGDDTLEQLRELEREIAFLTVMQAPLASTEGEGSGPRDRLAHAIEVRNFNLALDAIDHRNFTHVMKLDGDIELPPHYLRILMERFSEDPSLGLAGGVLVEPTTGGGMRQIQIPSHHVHGALKCYSRDCFNAIGGLQERLGWDTIDGTYARMRGFRTRNFTELVSVHHRPIASADGRLRGRARHGECAYITHYGPLWVTVRALKVARSRPVGLSGIAFLYGYARAFVRRVERVPDREYRRFTRRELYGRLLGVVPALGRGLRSSREQRPLSNVV
jgi:glycosyltransferase involved in cell wall biosynthesis